MKKTSAGFTLVELIVIIIILGILAVVAVPRFINQTSNARKSALAGLQGAINSAVALAQAEFIAEGNTSASAATVTITMNGQNVTVLGGANVGRPTADAAGVGVALQALAGFTAAYSAGVATFDFSPTSITSCNLTYTATTGSVATVTTGC